MSEPEQDLTESSSSPSPSMPAAPTLLRRERASAPGTANILAVVVLVATVLPAIALLREAARDDDDSAVIVADADNGSAVVAGAVDTSAVSAALDDVGARLDAANAANAALLARAVEAERGNRLRLLGRAVARARDTRRAAGLAGAELKSPFPANELGDLGELGFGPSRWLIARDGSAVIVPAGVQVPAALATAGRDEEPLSLAADGATPALVRRCLPNEGYCIIDVDDVGTAATPISLDAVRSSVATLSTPPTSPTTAPASSTSTKAPRSSTLPTAIALLAVVGGAVVAWRLWSLGALVRRRAWRLRAGVARGDDATGGLAELRELDDAIDDAIARLGDGAIAADVQRRRRERLQVVGAALDDARDRGGVPRVDADEDDDVALAAVAFSVNALLDTLDARATRMKLALDDVDGALKVLTPLAQRLLRLARLPDLPPQAVDELTSLGTALGQRARRVGALPALLDEAARLAPASSDVVARADALRSLPGDEALRLGISAQQGLDGSDPGADAVHTPDRPAGE